MTPTDEMKTAGADALRKAGSLGLSPEAAAFATYTAMESARDPDELREAAQELVNKLDECAPHVANLSALQFVRSGTQYTGPSYGEALETLRTALSRNRGDAE
jgi:hypothetical protein